MPLYSFQNPETGEIKDVFFKMTDKKVFSENGILFKRIFTKPQMAIDTKVDPNSPKDFVRATNKFGTFGDLQDRSAELSEQRREKNGVDPIQEKYLADYSKKRKGKKHEIVLQRELKASLDKSGFDVEF